MCNKNNYTCMPIRVGLSYSDSSCNIYDNSSDICTLLPALFCVSFDRIFAALQSRNSVFKKMNEDIKYYTLNMVYCFVLCVLIYMILNEQLLCKLSFWIWGC